jgi:hypothetical protein
MHPPVPPLLAPHPLLRSLALSLSRARSLSLSMNMHILEDGGGDAHELSCYHAIMFHDLTSPIT